MMNDVSELIRIVTGKPKTWKSYQDYLQSEDWRIKREQKLNQVGRTCQICNGKYRLNIHHRTYERLYNEDLNDLTVLCSTCHKIFHEKGRLNVSKRKTSKNRIRKI